LLLATADGGDTWVERPPRRLEHDADVGQGDEGYQSVAGEPDASLENVGVF
jgi:hypothetical protein